MKIFAASDIHSDTRHIEKLAERAEKEKVDLVILCGDLTLAENSVEGIVGPFKKRGLKVALIPGNHESAATTNFLCELYNAYNLHGYGLKIGDIGIFGCGGANIGPHQTTESEFYELIKKSFYYVKDAKTRIMVTHLHPDKTIFGMNKFPGSKVIRKAIDMFQPDLHLFGHVHEAEGLEDLIGKTKLFNVGKKGKIIEI